MRAFYPCAVTVAIALAGVSPATPAPFRPNPHLERFDPRADYRYELGTADAIVHTVELDESGFAWPAGLDGDTALLEIEVVDARRGAAQPRGGDPGLRAQGGTITVRQVFEPGARGRRVVDLSPFLRASFSGAITLALDGVRLRAGSAKLFVYRNPLPSRSTRVLVVAPHPDDAEIAAFGVYSSTDADVVTVTSGDAGEQGFEVIFPEPGEHYRMKGWIRTWDSITVPFFGGVLPGRARNLGYYDATLGRLWGSRPAAVEPLLATLDRPGHYRELNIDPVLKERPFTGTWSSLVGDLRAELERVNPRVVVAAHPLLDRHRDHRFATLRAAPGARDLAGRLRAVALHQPLGRERSVAAGSARRHDRPAALVRRRPLLQPHLLASARRGGARSQAGGARGDARPASLRPARRLTARSRRSASASRSVRYDYFRRAPRPNELFFVLTRDDASRLRTALLDRSRMWETLRDAIATGACRGAACLLPWFDSVEI